MVTSTREIDRRRILIRLSEIRDLPTLPAVFMNILYLMRNPNTPIGEIAKAIESDPAITMKILRLINSSFYGLAKPVNTVQQAIVLLGSSTLKNIVISTTIIRALDGDDQHSDFNREALWQHSIGCGLIAHLLGKHLGLPPDEERFVAGVIHDVGKIALDVYFRPEMKSVLKCVRQRRVSFVQAEREILGTDHTEIGAYIAETWMLPLELVELIAHHHDDNPDSQQSTLTALIQVSDMLVRKYGVGSGGDALVPEINPWIWEKLNLSEPLLISIDEDLKAEAAKVLGPIVKMRK